MRTKEAKAKMMKTKTMKIDEQPKEWHRARASELAAGNRFRCLSHRNDGGKDGHEILAVYVRERGALVITETGDGHIPTCRGMTRDQLVEVLR